MKKFIIKSVTWTAAVIASAQAVEHNALIMPNFTVEWHEITQETYSTMLPLFNAIKPVYVDAFLNLVHTITPGLAHEPGERTVPTVTTITASLQADWTNRITKLYTELHDGHIAIAYLAIARDNEQAPIGFVLFKQRDIKKVLANDVINIIEGSLDRIDSNPDAQDQIYVSPLAVKPGTQKKGVGKALVLVIFDHCPQIKKIYLRTYAHKANKNAQNFYEHVGFRRTITGSFTSDKDDFGLGNAQIVYEYRKT
jgi:GNAT superfamily N-acetyltransferase